VAEAKEAAAQALAVCAEANITVLSHAIVRALGLAEAKAGDCAGGGARLERLIGEQTALGVTGLHLGTTYEARARVAIWAADTLAIKHFGRLTAREYRHGQGSPLAARYQRLLDESRAAVTRGLPNLWELDTTRVEEGSARYGSLTSIVSRALEGAEPAGERAARALRLLCGEKATLEAHLFLYGGTGLSLVASQGSAGVPRGLREHLSDYLFRELHACDGETAVSVDLTNPLSGAPVAFCDERGRRYTPICLVATVDGKARYAGVAVLVDPENHGHQTDVGLASALGAHFIDVGDTLGVAVEGGPE
jgi:hypothetical protein